MEKKRGDCLLKKILIFNGYYYPSKNCGGPITSIENVINACSDTFDFYVICYNHDFNDSSEFDVPLNKWIKNGYANVMYVKKGYLDFSFKHLYQLFDDLQPDLIWFSGVLTPNNKVISTVLGRKLNIPILFSPRGEVSEDRVKLKAYKKIPYLNLIKMIGLYKGCYFHATSDDEEAGIKKFFAPDEDHLYRSANIGIAAQPLLCSHEKKENNLNVFFFSRIHEVKNLLFAIKAVNACKSFINFDIYGPIESEDYWNECLKEINRSPQNVSINYCGILDYSNKHVEIQKHDLFLFPTINENYGHVIAESLANHRPVMLSKGTTPWDDLDNKAGYVYPLDRIEDFTSGLDYLAKMSSSDFNLLINSTKQFFKEKTESDDAIKLHKNMFASIIGEI